MNKKILLRVFGLLIILVLVFSLTESIFRSNQELSIQAQPQGPHLVAQNPIEGQRLRLDATIEITFDRDMDPMKTAGAFSFLSASEPVSGKVTWRNARTLIFTPDKPLTPSTEYTATIDTTATALDQAALLEAAQ